jgi:SAM-dependent methyltransferase
VPELRPTTSESATLSAFAEVLDELAIPAGACRSLGAAAGAAPGSVWLPSASEIERAKREADPQLASDGWLLAWLAGAPTDAEIARLRNALWPWVHVGALYRSTGGRTTRENLQGHSPGPRITAADGVLLAARRREHAMSPRATTEKFDKNAGGWNGEPGRPGYAHFRWMRKYVALFGERRDARSILDFGCGAGWVGIEAALAAPGASLSAFDPSPAMVEIAESNARSSGVASFRGRVGFGENPPFDERFDYVVSSGVVSFSPDRERWLDGLARCVAPGATLVLGDVNRDSRGMRERRETRPLLPARELNAMTAHEARAALERRGFRHEATAGYQRTTPIPQLAHWSDTRLGGLLSPLLLAYNRACAGATDDLARFDSWVARFRAP